jgi:hypothetical protein
MKLIGITGKARSGKDTIAKHLWAEHEFTRIALADPLKLAAQHMFGLSDDQTWNPDFKEVVIPYWGMSPRQMFQDLGTKAAKGTFGSDVWVKRWLLSYKPLHKTDDVVVPDVRVDVEAEAIRQLGGVIVEVRRGTGLVGSTGAHETELGLSTLPDYVIENYGTREELHARIDEIVGVLR